MRILVVDDEERFAGVICRVLKHAGYKDVDFVLSAELAIEQIRTRPCDILVTDLRLGGVDGIKLMALVKRRSPGTDTILMTAFADVATARSALKRGALDYLVKPFDNDELISLVAQSQARRSVVPSDADEDSGMFAGMIGRSDRMRNVFRKIEKTAHTDAAVLILGASGTGKELAARAVHSLGVRHQEPFVVIPSPAIPAALIESELFGHEKGAFTGADAMRRGHLEIADGGTVFFDEIAEMPMELQPKLLRFLQEREFMRVGGANTVAVDVRIVAATNKDIEKAVRDGAFREDLLYRLDVVRIEMPLLKERRDDIELLARHFLVAMGRSHADISPGALRVLQEYDWPGNVRELQNTIERAVIESEGNTIDVIHLRDQVTGQPGERSETAGASEANLDLETNEARIIEEALVKAGGNKSNAAKLLGITRRKLYSRIKLLGLDTSR